MEAVYGRALGLRELRHLSKADQVFKWTVEQQSSEMATWARQFPEKERAVSAAARIALDMGLIEST